MKAVAYARVSTTNHGQDTENQLHTIRDVARNRSFDLTREYVDTGVSGTAESRPALDDMIRDARHGRFQVIIIAALDRLGRNVRQTLNLIHELETHGVALISLREGMDFTTPIGKMLLTQLLAFAQLERDLISDRVKTAIAVKRSQAKRAGKPWIHGRPRKTDDAITGEIRSLRAAGKTIREIAEAVGGLSPSAVHRALKASIA